MSWNTCSCQLSASIEMDSMNFYGIPMYSMEPYGFLWIPRGSYGFYKDSYVFLWIPMGSSVWWPMLAYATISSMC